MKSEKILGAVAIVCLLLGTSSAAMAQGGIVDCFNLGGTITGGNFVGIIADTHGADCTIVGVTVGAEGVKSRRAGTVIMTYSVVKGGDVRIIEAQAANLIGNLVREGGDVVLKNNRVARVQRNTVTHSGKIRVVDNGRAPWQQWAEVLGNLLEGDMSVRDNLSAVVSGNNTQDGNIVCADNLSLFASGNVARGGRVVCNQALVAPDPIP